MIWHPNHPPCDGGCGELADECQCARPNALGSMRVEPALGSIAENGLRDVRAALNSAPRPRHHTITDPDPVRARAIQRARNERTKDTP